MLKSPAMDWRGAYQISLSLIALLAFAGAAWLMVAPEPSPGIEIIPPPSADAPSPASASGAAAPAGDSSVQDGDALSVNLNTASASELTALPGIGETLAARIVAWREENGPFDRVDQVMAVYGIGPATYERIRPYARARE